MPPWLKGNVSDLAYEQDGVIFSESAMKGAHFIEVFLRKL